MFCRGEIGVVGGKQLCSVGIGIGVGVGEHEWCYRRNIMLVYTGTHYVKDEQGSSITTLSHFFNVILLFIIV